MAPRQLPMQRLRRTRMQATAVRKQIMTHMLDGGLDRWRSDWLVVKSTPQRSFKTVGAREQVLCSCSGAGNAEGRAWSRAGSEGREAPEIPCDAPPPPPVVGTRLVRDDRRLPRQSLVPGLYETTSYGGPCIVEQVKGYRLK